MKLALEEQKMKKEGRNWKNKNWGEAWEEQVAGREKKFRKNRKGQKKKSSNKCKKRESRRKEERKRSY